MIPVISCPECAGLTFTLVACRCASGGDRFLVEWDAVAGQPWRDCQLCQGVGTVAQPCLRCRQLGRRRAQLVLTVANLDSGAVASRNVVPGSVEPVPAPGGGWQLALVPVVRELAATVGAASVTDASAPRRPLGELTVPLPEPWRPELPTEQRYALEAEAVTRWTVNPWWLYLGRDTAPAAPDLDAELSRLCAVADLLCLDLVVEARRLPWGELSWDVRYEVPSTDVPATVRGTARDLPEAVATTRVSDALDGLADRGLTAGAYAIELAALAPPGTPKTDLDQLERRVHADLRDGAPGAQAIWRDGRWWHTRLQPGGSTETLRERATGQVARRWVTVLLRTSEPPAPTWRGAPIGYVPCPDCAPDSRLRRCYCTMGGRDAEPDCAGCGGAGYAPSELSCPTCRDSRRAYQAVMVTVTDLRSRVVHQLWAPPDSASPDSPSLVGTQPNGLPVYQLPDRYRLGRWAATFRVRPEDLTEADGGHEIGQDLREGVVTVPGGDPVAQYVFSAGRGQPGGRLIVLATVPDVPPLSELIRLALGLGLGLEVGVENHRLDAGDPLRLHGERWLIEIVPSGGTGDGLPLWPTLETATAHCLEYLANALVEAVPADPDQPIPVPQSVAPVAVADPTPLISRLGYHYAGQAVTVRFDRDGCRVYLRERSGARLLARAGTLADAVTVLGIRS